MNGFPSSLRSPLLGALAGGLAGFALYRFVGCRTGACPLMSQAWIAISLWALIGLSLGLRPPARPARPDLSEEPRKKGNNP